MIQYLYVNYKVKEYRAKKNSFLNGWYELVDFVFLTIIKKANTWLQDIRLKVLVGAWALPRIPQNPWLELKFHVELFNLNFFKLSLNFLARY